MPATSLIDTIARFTVHSIVEAKNATKRPSVETRRVSQTNQACTRICRTTNHARSRNVLSNARNSITVEFLTVDNTTIDSLVSRLLIELSKIGFSHDIQSYASNLNGDLVKISIEDAKTVKFTIKHNQGTLQ